MKKTTETEARSLNRQADMLEEAAAMLLTIANQLRKAARGQWHPDYPSSEEEEDR